MEVGKVVGDERERERAREIKPGQEQDATISEIRGYRELSYVNT